MQALTSRGLWLLACALVAALPGKSSQADEFQSRFASTPNRVWIGREYWANPMEDWRIQDGQLECLSGGANRNVHLLAAHLANKTGGFSVSVQLKVISQGQRPAAAGFRLGARDEIDDYRAAALRGRGLDVGVTSDGVLFLGKTTQKTTKALQAGRLEIQATPDDDGYQVELTLLDPSGEKIGSLVRSGVQASLLTGNVALIHNPSVPAGRGRAVRFGFSNWKVSGEKVATKPERSWGPILWAMHTLHRMPEGYLLKLTAQMPPMGKQDGQEVSLAWKTERWQEPVAASIDPLSRTATFRITNWDGSKDIPYRLTYRWRDGDRQATHTYTGTFRRDPREKGETVVAGFTGNQDYAFPNREITANVKIHNPDVLFFSGDQIYEGVGGYGIIRGPVGPAADHNDQATQENIDRSVLNYLRKWYLLGWAFGDLMRDRVTICLPDDHDVYQGNIWGEAGKKMPSRGSTSSSGGYRQHPEFVNAVHRTQCSHHPDFADPTPVKQDISVFYGPLCYGRVSFAIIADRQFKSGPARVADWKGRADHLQDPSYHVTKLDKPGLELLGDRQEKFLEGWAADWYGANFKCVLSQTIFCNLANYHGGKQEFIYADLDSNGWPQSGRRRALQAMRKGYAFHYAGDQHLPSIVHHGLDQFGDAGWSFCVPSIAAGYPRSWQPDKEGRPVKNRVAGPNTGDYLDGFGNKMTVWAIGNPEKRGRKGRIQTAHDKASGYGLVRFQHAARTITMECWRLLADLENPDSDDQFPGWPKTIKLTDNDGRQPAGYLPQIRVEGLENAVLQVYEQPSDKLVYALRIRGDKVRPWVFETNKQYRVRLGDPEQNLWKEISNLQVTKTSSEK